MGLRDLRDAWKAYRAWARLRDAWRKEMASSGFSWAVSLWKGLKQALLAALSIAFVAAAPAVLEKLTDSAWLADQLQFSPKLEGALIVVLVMLARMVQNWLKNRKK